MNRLDGAAAPVGVTLITRIFFRPATVAPISHLRFGAKRSRMSVAVTRSKKNASAARRIKRGDALLTLTDEGGFQGRRLKMLARFMQKIFL